VDLSIQEKQYTSALALLERANAQYPQKADTAATLAYLLATAPGPGTRNGSRALQLAQKAYAVTGSVQHGAVIALAFGELNRCAEAAAWQRKMINQAEQQQQSELAGKLKKDLPLYEGKQMCRPAGP
jgi:hypothetical protein